MSTERIPILTESKKQQAEAWEAVVSTLDEVACGWANDPGCGSDNACNTIRALAREVKERRARDAKVAELARSAELAVRNIKTALRIEDDIELGTIRQLGDAARSLAAALSAIRGDTP